MAMAFFAMLGGYILRPHLPVRVDRITLMVATIQCLLSVALFCLAYAWTNKETDIIIAAITCLSIAANFEVVNFPAGYGAVVHFHFVFPFSLMHSSFPFRGHAQLVSHIKN